MNEINLKDDMDIYHLNNRKSKIKWHFKQVSYHLTKGVKSSLILELISIVINMMQLLSFSINSQFSDIWKIPWSQNISGLFQYFQMFTLLSGSSTLFILMLYVFFIWIVIIGSLTVLSIKIQNQTLTNWLSKVLTALAYPLFTPLFWFFLSVRSCSESQHKFINEFKCWDSSHYFHSAIGWISAVILIILSMFTVITIYSMDLFKCNPVTAKTTSKCDTHLLFIKAIISIIYSFTSSSPSSQIQWAVIIMYSMVSIYIFQLFNTLRPYLNKRIMKAYSLTLSIYAWCNISLLISKIFQNTNFDSCWPWFIFGSWLMCFVIYFEKRVNIDCSIMQGDSPETVIYKINNWQSVIDNLEESRVAQIIFKRYSNQYEKNCTNRNCELKRYLNSGENSKEKGKIFLYQHIERLYLNALDYYNSNTKICINYSLFLLNTLKNKKISWTELWTWDENNLSFEEEFFVYKYIHFLEQHEYLDDESFIEDKGKHLSVIYWRKLELLKQLIKTVTALYIEFWNILLLSDVNNKDSLHQLNEWGKKIKQHTKESSSQFNEWQNIKRNDKETLALFAEFQNNVTNNKELSLKIKGILNEIESNNDADENQSFDFNTLDPNMLHNDNNQFIILSSQNDSFGKITNMSLNLCSLWGYLKKEIIGVNYEKLLPNIFAQVHTELLQNKINVSEQMDIPKEKHGRSFEKSVDVNWLSKLKYWIPINITVSIVENENNEKFFVGRIQEKKNKQGQEIFIWIDNDLTIQNYSVNAVKYWGMNNNTMSKGKMCISEYIKEFSEEILKCYSDAGLKGDKQVIQIKKDIQKKKYLNQEIEVTWHDNNERKSSTPMLIKVKEQKIQNNVLGYWYIWTPQTIKTAVPSEIVDDWNMNYISKDNSNFIWDIKTMSYIKGNQTQQGTMNDLKQWAWNKIENRKQITMEELSDITESEESSSNSHYHSSNSDDNSKSEASLGLDESIWGKESKKKIVWKSSDDYYHVNMTKIKFHIYNFTKAAILEDNTFVKVSEIESKIMEKSGMEEKDKKETTKSHEPRMNNAKQTDNENKEWLEIDDSFILWRQIEGALTREESQPTIIKMKINSLISIIWIIGIGGVFCYISWNSFQNLYENVVIVQYSYDIIANIFVTYYYIMELSLYNYEKYKLPVDHVEKRQEMKDFLMDSVNLTNYRLNLITTTFAYKTNEVKEFIQQDNILIGSIGENYTIIYYNTTIQGAFCEWNSALFGIANAKDEDIFPTEKNVFFYNYNGPNSIDAAFLTQTEMMLENWFHFLGVYKKNAVFTFSAWIVIWILSYLILSFSYEKVAKKKEGYLEVFYDIDKGIVSCFAETCEVFNENLQLKLKEGTKETSTIHSNVDIDDNVMDSSVNSSLVKAKNKGGKKKINSKETITVKLWIGIVLFLLFIYGLVVFLLYYQYLTLAKTRQIVFQNFSMLNLSYLRYYNSIRTYIFDSKSILSTFTGTVFVDELLTIIYTRLSERKSRVTDNINEYPQVFVSWFKEIYEKNVCKYGDVSIFAQYPEYTCDTYLNGSAKLGFEYMISSYITEMLSIKNTNLEFEKNKNESFVYNLTYIGVPKRMDETLQMATTDELKKNYWDNHKINIFNSDSWIEVNYFLVYFINPIWNDLNINIKDSIRSIVSHKKNEFVYCWIAFMIVNAWWSLFILLPFINRQNMVIFQTKNMLGWIPNHVLWTMPNICSVLNINIKNKRNTNNTGVHHLEEYKSDVSKAVIEDNK